MTRPLVLVPSSKAKAAGGRGTPYGASRALARGRLAASRAEVLDALGNAADQLDAAGIARLCGVKAGDVDTHRAALRTIADAPTMRAQLRYTGVVHRFAGLASVPQRDVGVQIGTFTGLLGVAMHDEPVPDYRLEVTGRVPGLGVLATWWREDLGAHLRAAGRRRRIWDLLPGEFARMWPDRERRGLDVITVRFERGDGRAAPAASAKVAKGQLLRLLVDAPTTTPDELVGDASLDGWSVERRDAGLVAIQRA